ncbi:MAG: GDP-mannose 4,6-dehydratase [Acidobacteria bacterium]|nr:GDP-mannose 4,6-dehydratase [Acidobacteriota bacterium]
MRVLVTGVAGFIGSNLLERLLRGGYEVTGADNLSQSDGSNLAEFAGHPHFRFEKADVRDLQAVRALARGVDAIIHLAAYKIPRYGNRCETLEVNTQGTANILRVAADGQRRVLFASTSDVYGKNPTLPFSERSDLWLGGPSIARWAYAASKIYDEHLCLAYSEERAVPVSIVRYFGSYGPKQHLTWWGGPQAVFIGCALKGKPLPIHGDGLQTRSFTYVTDTVEGTLRVLESADAVGKAVNIGNSQEISVLDLAKLIWTLAGEGAPRLEFVSYRSFAGRYEDVRRRVPDTTLARSLLGFEARVPLVEGLQATIAWQRGRVEG